MKNATKAERQSKKKKTIEAQEHEQTKAPESVAQAGTTTATPKKTAAKTKAGAPQRREHIVQLAGRIAELRSQLKVAEAELDSMLGTARSGTKAPTTAKGREGSVAARVIEAMGTDTTATFTAASLAEKLQVDVANVRSALLRLVKLGKVQRQERGQYVAVLP